ncbi:RNA polymerase factor sigma-70 [Duganella sp. FT3S]|uniref:RNA polymerase factor sigma-70 n=1 Tax=Rugamonas fusca TaxID=2758568 RepID=A0A7W2EE04_9BURK|nr:RNA polymerase factor sigma-70 [Rugamonas fusca]MBA5604209.1 RNA polymerase factor sigma-70 [Rugamonas fusca]
MTENETSQEPVLGTDATGTLLDDVEFLTGLRQQMLRFATLQLNDSTVAEDAVQEALIGALRNVQSFGARAAMKTWVFAILRNKIADVLRQKKRMIEASALMRDSDEDEDLSELFDRKGFWQADERPVAWRNPEESLHDAQFWRVFEICLDKLPGQQGRLFMMREFIELDTPEICEATGITVSNLNVTLHRARLRLRECLENNWFSGASQSC